MSDISGQVICNESTGSLTLGAPVGSNNYARAQNGSPGVIGSPPSEVFAEAFGWSAYTKTLSPPPCYANYFQMTTDGLFANGYFGCSIAYANYALTGSLILPPNCN